MPFQVASPVLQSFDSLAKSCTNARRITMESCFHEIALKHLDALFGYAMTLTRSKPDAEDLVQETYLRAARAHSRLEPGSQIRSWLYTILRNTFLNQVRHRNTGPLLVEMDDDFAVPTPLPDENAINPLESYLADEKKRDIQEAIESLPAIFREIIVLREFQDLSYQEIADVLHCPVGTVMSRLGRARDKLRQMLQHLSEENAV
jgi:RNA polymerase sigma-70 factor, ECF subfamily